MRKIHFRPKLWRDVCCSEDGVRYIRGELMGRELRTGMSKWRGVHHLWGPFWIDHKNPSGSVREFADHGGCFEPVGGE